MKLYHTPHAPSPERVTQFLKVKGRLNEVEIHEISIMKLEHKTPDYKAVSPFSQIPALVLDDDTVLTETRAICTYFEGMYPDPNLMGSDPKDKALIEMWDRRIELMMLVPFAMWFRNGHPRMAVVEKPQIPDAAAKGERQAKWFASKLDQHLAGHEWVAADRYSIADITLKIVCEFTAAMKWMPHTQLENLGRWYQQAKAKVPD